MECKHKNKQAVASFMQSCNRQLVSVICVDCGEIVYCKCVCVGNEGQFLHIKDFKKEGLK